MCFNHLKFVQTWQKCRAKLVLEMRDVPKTSETLYQLSYNPCPPQKQKQKKKCDNYQGA